jgi:hypothetical protein
MFENLLSKSLPPSQTISRSQNPLLRRRAVFILRAYPKRRSRLPFGWLLFQRETLFEEKQRLVHHGYA